MTFHRLGALHPRRIHLIGAGLGAFITAIGVMTVLPAAQTAAISYSTTSSATGALDPASFTATPGISDPACNAGRGVQFTAPWIANGAPSIAATISGNGSTFVAVTSGYPPHPFVIIHDFGSDCTPDHDFGHDGVATIAFPKLRHSERYTITAINAISPAQSGEIILVGQTTGGWLVGELAQNGRLDARFGQGGWTVLPWPGQAAAVLQEPSGRIIVAGEAGAGCCVNEWVSALSSSGTLDKHFGVDGRVGIPSGEDSGVSRLALEPNGDILALTVAGNMGCWDDLVAALTPNGLPVAGFLDYFGTNWRSELVPQGVSTGDLVVRGAGFVLVGTRQQTCVSNTADPTAGGHMAVFESDGKLETSFATGGVATFSSPMQGQVWAFSAAGGDVLMLGMPAPVQVENSDSTEALDLVALLPNGEVDSRYGAGGRAQVQLASLLNDSPGSFVPVTVAGEGKWIAIVSSTASGKGLQLIRIRS